MAIILSLDAGTTSVRTLAINERGEIVDQAQQEFPQYFPQPGWVEHDAQEIWEAAQKTLTEVAERLTQPVVSIAIANQRETVVAWHAATGLPQHRAIVWQDRRTADRCQELTQAGHLPLVREATGLVLDPYFSGTKMAWLLGEGNVSADADLRLGTIDSWLLWKLTGGKVHATEPSNASRTMLFDLRSGCWSEELCDLLGVPLAALPEVFPSSGRFGVTDAASPVGPGVPISGMAGDQQAALFGQACFAAGQAKNTYGTGCFLLANIGDDLPAPADGLLTTVAWQREKGGPLTYAREGSIFSAGSAVQWLRDGLGIIDHASDLEGLAQSVPDTGDVFLVPAFTGLGSPWWDPWARGTLVGLTRGTGRAEMARAVVEAMVFQTRDVVDAMSREGLTIADLRIDGGAAVMELLLDLQADQLNIPVTRSATTEATALGAAWLAGLAEGVWDSLDELSDLWQADRTALPAADRSKVNVLHHRWLQAVDRSRQWEQPPQ